jgi:hypothetical protein
MSKKVLLSLKNKKINPFSSSTENIRNWFDIVKDGIGGYSGEIKTTFSPIISISSWYPNIIVSYYDSINYKVRVSYGRDPNFIFSFIEQSYEGVINVVVNATNIYILDSTSIYLYSFSLSLLATYLLSNINHEVKNVSLKKFIYQKNSILILTINNSIYELDTVHNQIVSDYIPGDYNAYLINNNLYLAYTRISDIAIVSYNSVFGSLFKMNVQDKKKLKSSVLITTIPKGTSTKPRIIYLNGNINLFLLNGGTINFYTINLATNKASSITNSKIKANEIKVYLYQNYILLVCLDNYNKLFQLQFKNNALILLPSININNTIVINSAYEFLNINNEQYIFYIDSKNLLRQLWNPIIEIDLNVNVPITTLSITNYNSNAQLLPIFNKNISDYTITTSNYFSKDYYTILLNSINTINILAFPNQLVKIKDSNNLSYFIKLIPLGLNNGTSQIVNPLSYKPGYYLTAPFIGSNYWTIYDKNAVPIWYQRTNFDSNNLSLPITGCMTLGSNPNNVILQNFSGTLQTKINVNTLEKQNFFPKNDTRYNLPTSFSGSDILQIKAPSNRKGNLLYLFWFSLTYPEINNAWYIQEQDLSGNNIFELYSEDYFNNYSYNYFGLNSFDVHPVSGDIICSFGTANAVGCFRYSNKNLDWMIDSRGLLGAVMIDSSLTKSLTINDTTQPYNYSGFIGQHNVRWQTIVKPYNPANLVISLFDNQSTGALPSRGTIFEIDLSSNLAINRSVNYNSSIIGDLGSYMIIKETNNSTTHLVNYGNTLATIFEYVGNSFGLATNSISFFMTFDNRTNYRIEKVSPTDLSINNLRKTSGMPFWTS